MKKSGIFRIAAYGIFLAIFNLVLWLCKSPSEMTTVNWIAYGFIHGSYLLILISPLLTSKHEDGRVGGFLLKHISVLFFMLQFVIGIVFVSLPGTGSGLLKAAIGIFGVIFLVYLGMVLVVMFTSTLNVEQKPAEKEYQKVKVSLSALNVARERTADADIKAHIDAVLEKAAISSVSPAVSDSFAATVPMLEKAIRVGDKVKALSLADNLLSLLG